MLKLKWVESDGPLLVLEQGLVQNWHGCFGTSKPDVATDDYERACAINDYVGLVDVDDHYGLVLDDEPMMTTWWSSAHDEGGVLVRWMWAESEDSVRVAMAQLSNIDWLQSNIRFCVESGKLLLFDSSSPGYDLDDGLRFDLTPGCYLVETAHWKPDTQTYLILHRFLQTNVERH